VTNSAGAFDHHMMGIALTMARQGLGVTSPNPSVGAVLVDPATGELIARGTTAAGGRPHAERIAIGRAGPRARGSTLYVTLEPCSHVGQTSPCADAVIAAGIARVVCGIEDPDPRVSGRGLNRLRAAGIAVSCGVRAVEAATVTRGHIVRATERRPFVQLKLALDRDGSVPVAVDGAPRFVTCPEARALGHVMRAQADAILVGRGTVAGDNPELTCRLPGLAQRSPRRIVLASRGVELAGTRLAATATTVPLTVFVGRQVSDRVVTVMQEAGATVAIAPLVGGSLWLPSVLESLAADGVTRLLVEGGPAVWRAFARSGLVDEVVMFVAGGGHLQNPLALASRHLGALPLVVKDQRKIGCDRVWRLSR
jgi:diaminohydroxyphosphoribosylaminopyrimidine deaminase / 5-amino-6-(5-phosphoribosylamino)uracil reductase